MEFVSPKKRIITLCTSAFSWGTGILLATPAAYLIRDWRYLQLAVALPSVIYLLFWRIIPESPRWLISRGKYVEAESVVRWVAEVNKAALPEGQLFDEHSLRSTPTLSPLKLRKAPKLIVRTVIISFAWLTVGVSWYGLTLNQGSLDGDIFINALVLALIDFIAAFSLLIINIIGRKKTFCAAMMISALAMLSTILMHFFANKDSSTTSTTFTTLYTIGKLGVSCSFNLLFMWNGEFYPTALRNFGLGMGCAFGRLGAVISPIVMDQLREHPYLGNTIPMMLFGCMTLVSSLSGLYLPETAHKHLPETLEDAENFGVKRCAIPDLANDTFGIQGTWHQHLINQTIPVDENGEYEGCLWRSGNDSGNGSVLPCKDWVYDTSFGLFCDSSLLINMVNVVYLAGVAVGAIVGGLAADFIGRKWVSFIACLIHGVGGLGAAFSPNYGAYVAFRVFVGSCHGILNNSVVVLSMEFVSPRRRLVSVCTLAMSWGIGMVLTTPVAYLIRDWKYLQLAVALPPFLYLGFWW
ncbi:organic cation transporter protein-like [Lingula anatina]|uniref:Organic cation transporter protein-like n=1 Tax=Lingula anatina TaxID=7574 RepID=A0A1S3HVK0_LINAN|nr:organic cation transporter protein-like [Lingula anatina]|eukprot:XP_013389571.1 organic cation transporter protein-like [Lingula anatina]